MLIYLLDENFKVILPTDMITSLQWYTRYYDAGSFEIHLSVSQVQIDNGTLDSYRKSAYVYNEENSSTGIIQEFEYNDYNCKIKGRTLEAVFNDRVIDTQFTMNGKAEDVARALVNRFAIAPDDQSRKIPKLYLGTYLGLGESISYSHRGKQIGESIGEILYTQELSYRLRYDFGESRVYFEVFEGIDRTQNQNVNTWAVFSKDFGNIIDGSEKYTCSNNYKNFAYVAGMGEGEERVIVTINQIKDGEDIKELWVDARDLQRAAGQSEADYRNQLITRGEQKLSEYQQTESVQFQIYTTADVVFSIGDICEYVNNDLGIVTTGRITEINEVWEANGYEKRIIFGEEQFDLTQKVKRSLG